MGFSSSLIFCPAMKERCSAFIPPEQSTNRCMTKPARWSRLWSSAPSIPGICMSETIRSKSPLLSSAWLRISSASRPLSASNTAACRGRSIRMMARRTGGSSSTTRILQSLFTFPPCETRKEINKKRGFCQA